MKNNGGKGIGFCGLLGIAFIVLKLLGVIKWSWLWVLAPVWIPALIMVVLFAVGMVLYLIGSIGEKRSNR